MQNSPSACFLAIKRTYKDYITLYKFLIIILSALTACAFIGCKRPNAPTAEREATDSVIATHVSYLFTAPEKADSAFAAWQSRLTDSVSWYKMELFRGTACSYMSDTAGMAFHYNRVVAWCRRNPEGSRLIEGLLWNHNGVYHMQRGELKAAIACGKRAVHCLSQPPKSKDLIAATINLADMHLQNGNIAEAAEHYRDALLLCDSLHDGSNLTSVCAGLGLVYMELGNYHEAHRFFNRARNGIEHEDVQRQLFFYISHGNCYYYEQHYAEALTCFKKAHALAQRVNDGMTLLNAEANLGEVYLMQDSVRQARHYLMSCKHRMNSADAAIVSQNSKFYIESLLADLAMAEGRVTEVQHFLNIPVDSFLKLPPRYLMLHYQRIVHYAVQAKHWHEAYVAQNLRNRFADTLRNTQTVNMVNEMAVRYRRDTTLLHQRATVATLKMQGIRQRNITIMAIGSTVIVALLAVIIIMGYRRRTRKRLQRQMLQMNELRMHIVRNRVSPHYIFNVLGTVLPSMQRYPELADHVEKLIDVLRGNLLSSGKVAVPLRDEIALVQRYVNLYHTTHGARPKVTWNVADALQHSDRPVLSMSVQIPVENALKHAFPTLSDESVIHIDINETIDSTLVLTVTDNGVGYNPGKIKRTNRDTGTGLRLIARTIDILNQYNSKQAVFIIENLASLSHGTRMQLRLPQNYTFPSGEEGE